MLTPMRTMVMIMITNPRIKVASANLSNVSPVVEEKSPTTIPPRMNNAPMMIPTIQGGVFIMRKVNPC